MLKKLKENPAVCAFMLLYLMCFIFMLVSFEFIDLIYLVILLFYSYRFFIKKDEE